ncbi:cytochrome c biogenesis protein CcdA [uncultured Polaribacter sp.]|uniref:cytochrome c biogenesis protein CcdA n=1 Tax=uncultured Polaribacter sp. TaxID=174711 RepID=UPI002601A976|nr:cytochrome c biogenesis protein CcdA [uncultured Polaribacter sp.]
MEELWSFMLLAFGAGLAALLTPCVFPMIPLTVSFFGNKESATQSHISPLSRDRRVSGFIYLNLNFKLGTLNLLDHA